MDMATAPKDGTRILIKHETHEWTEDGQRVSGTSISECHWESNTWGKRWAVWCGNKRTMSTAHIVPLAWCHVPEELKGP